MHTAKWSLAAERVNNNRRTDMTNEEFDKQIDATKRMIDNLPEDLDL